VPRFNRGTGFCGFVQGSVRNAFLGAIEELTWELFSCTYMQAGRTWAFQRDFEIRGDVQFVKQCCIGRDRIWPTSRKQGEINATVDYRITTGALRNF
jgi:hypothetical protein